MIQAWIFTPASHNSWVGWLLCKIDTRHRTPDPLILSPTPYLLHVAYCLCTLLQAIMVELSLYKLLHLALMGSHIHKHLNHTRQVHSPTHQHHNHTHNIHQLPQGLSIRTSRSQSQMKKQHHLLLTMLQCLIWECSKYWIKTKITRYKIQDILLSFCAYNYTHIRQKRDRNTILHGIQTSNCRRKSSIVKGTCFYIFFCFC